MCWKNALQNFDRPFHWPDVWKSFCLRLGITALKLPVQHLLCQLLRKLSSLLWAASYFSVLLLCPIKVNHGLCGQETQPQINVSAHGQVCGCTQGSPGCTSSTLLNHFVETLDVFPELFIRRESQSTTHNINARLFVHSYAKKFKNPQPTEVLLFSEKKSSVWNTSQRHCSLWAVITFSASNSPVWFPYGYWNVKWWKS